MGRFGAGAWARWRAPGCGMIWCFRFETWLKWEVLAYCKSNRIEIPDAGRGDNGRFTLMDSEILHAYAHHREDYERMREFFPFIETVVLRDRWFGTGAA